MPQVIVRGSFDDLRCKDIRFLQEASRLGEVHALLWSDEHIRRETGASPKFPQMERLYLIQAVRYVHRAEIIPTGFDLPQNGVTEIGGQKPIWVVRESDDTPALRAYCAQQGLDYRVIPDAALEGYPDPEISPSKPGTKKVIVTGCFDWFHSGHVRFFEEASEFGDLYVVVGHDANVRLLKGEGHPLFPQEERRYIVQSIRYVKQAFISTGHGWMDAAPEIARIRPDIYVVNEDGDKPEKRAFCKEHGIEYIVLKRRPKEGLPRRTSTELRGF